MQATEIDRIVTGAKGIDRACGRCGMALWAGLFATSVAATGAMADEAPPELTTNWENTVTTTAAQRLNDNFRPFGYGYPGGAGSATAYDRGAFTPLRLDLLTELEMDYGPVGLRTTADARAERTLAKPSFDGSQGSRTEAELREAFVHGSTSIGEDQRLTVRLGRHTVIWGESVYFPTNGIAGGQAPIDTSMVEKISGYQGETIFLPVGQMSAIWQPGGSLAVEAYYQFEWRPSRIGSLGEYVAGSGPAYLARSEGNRPNSSDQYGVAVKWHRGDSDLGLYALSFDAKIPTLQFHPEAGLGNSPFGPVIGTYREDFPRGIQIYGISVAGPLGAASYGAEISARRNMPLVTGPVVYPLRGEQSAGATRSEYPEGDTLQAQFSWSYMTPPLPWVPDGAKWTGEIAANSLLQTTDDANLRSLDRTRNAAALRTVFQPQFLQALPRLDLTIPIGLGVNLFGLSAIDPQMNRGTGDISIGVVGTYDAVWTGALSLIHYFGTAKNVFPYTFTPAGRPLADADFISLSIQHSF